MIDYSWRLAKRFAVLVPGIVIAYFSARDIFPYFDKRLPLGAAVFITYVLAAYVLIPALIRLVRIVRPARHLPLYCVTPDGFASDPINIGIIGSRQQLIGAMERAGWYVADPHRIRHLPRQVLSVVSGWPYPNAPVSNLYLFGRKQDIAFEIPLEGTVPAGTTYASGPLPTREQPAFERQEHPLAPPACGCRGGESIMGRGGVVGHRHRAHPAQFAANTHGTPGYQCRTRSHSAAAEGRGIGGKGQ